MLEVAKIFYDSAEHISMMRMIPEWHQPSQWINAGSRTLLLIHSSYFFVAKIHRTVATTMFILASQRSIKAGQGHIIGHLLHNLHLQAPFVAMNLYSMDRHKRDIFQHTSPGLTFLLAEPLSWYQSNGEPFWRWNRNIRELNQYQVVVFYRDRFQLPVIFSVVF